MIENIDNYKRFFGEWFPYFEDFLKSDEFENIIIELQSRTKRGKIIFPYSSTLIKKCVNWKNPQNNIFKAFELTPFNELQVIILGLSPYFTIKNGKPIADGLAFSTQDKELPPSLRILYEAIDKDLYNHSNPDIIKSPDLSYLAEQGVLLMNSALTCEQHMPTVHIDIWKPLITHLFKIINDNFSNIHIILLGEEAQQYKKIINIHDNNGLLFPNYHYLYTENHPAYYARLETNMITNIFSLMKSRGVNIKWFKNI